MRLIAVCVLAFGLEAVLGLGASTNFFELDSARFEAAESQEIRTESINHDLLAAAILRETNERRRQRGLSALKHSARATEAAKIQSDIMRARGSISHDNPENARYRTLEQRVKAVGLKYRLVAENVATAFALQYESGKRFYPERKNGRTIFRYKPGGPPIQPHTYATFAKALVTAWMNSKGHRENILLKDAQYHGAHCSPGSNKETGIPTFYCTQVFFSPRD